MSEPIITAGQFSLAGIVILLVPILINHWLTNTRTKKNERTNIGRKVIDAFRPELDALIQSGNDAGQIMSDAAFNRHDSAIRDFLPYLSWVDRFRMKCAWNKLAYHKNDKKKRIPFYTYYADCGSLEIRRKVRPIAIQNIEKIMALAKK